MSPEWLEGDPNGYSFPSDIWSLGLVVHELALGYHPFEEAKDYMHILEMVRNRLIKPLPDTLSDGLWNFIDLCLQIDPKERPSVLDLIEHPWI